MKPKKIEPEESDRGIFTRKASIDIGQKVIKTPSRTLTITDIDSKRKLPTYIPLEGDILVLHTPIDLEKIYQIGERKSEANNYFKTLSNKLESYYGDLQNIHYIIPFVYLKKKKDRIYEHHLQNIKDILYYLFVMNEADYTFNTILFEVPTIRSSTRKDFLKDLIKSFESENIQLIPVIDIADHDFNGILNYIINEIDSKFIVVKYRKITNNISRYIKLTTKARKHLDRVFIIINVERHIEKIVGSHVRDFALPHYMPFIGFDIVIPKSKPVYGSRFPGFYKKPPKLRLFKRPELTIPLISQMSVKDRIRAIEELEINYYNDKEIKEISSIIVDREIDRKLIDLVNKQKDINDKEEAKIAKEMLKRLSAFTRTQEVIASIKEFNYFKSIQTVDNYLDLRNNIMEIHKSIISDKKLQEYSSKS